MFDFILLILLSLFVNDASLEIVLDSLDRESGGVK